METRPRAPSGPLARRPPLTVEGEVEAPEPVRGQAVRPALEDDGARLEHLDHLLNDWLEQLQDTFCFVFRGARRGQGRAARAMSSRRQEAGAKSKREGAKQRWPAHRALL